MTPKLIELQRNFYKVILFDVSYYFSYETLIAFQVKGKLIVTDMVYSRTTSKHCNTLCDKKIRVSNEVFLHELSKLVNNEDN